MVAYRQASSDNYAVNGNHSTGVRTTQEATNVGLPGPDAGQGGKSPEASYMAGIREAEHRPVGEPDVARKQLQRLRRQVVRAEEFPVIEEGHDVLQ